MPKGCSVWDILFPLLVAVLNPVPKRLSLTDLYLFKSRCTCLFASVTDLSLRVSPNLLREWISPVQAYFHNQSRPNNISRPPSMTYKYSFAFCCLYCTLMRICQLGLLALPCRFVELLAGVLVFWNISLYTP